MDDFLQDIVQGVTGATSIRSSDRVQSLWSGYGEILRVKLTGASSPSVIVKHVAPPAVTNHPRGWSSDKSHQRKLRSYEVEANWYRDWSDRCSEACRVPKCLHVQQTESVSVFVLEDLNSAGFSLRKSVLRMLDVHACLQWLADFHATFMTDKPNGLWPVGTYWHLATRPDEWDVMKDSELKSKAGQIDQTLSSGRFQTLVHGDAKVANFCFADQLNNVSAVDFQYVGGGCGMKDVAYFLGSCLSDQECEEHEDELLAFYFGELMERLRTHQPDIDPRDVHQEWRDLYCVAWADFNRFLAGWCPGHHKLTAYSRRMTATAIQQIG